MKILIVNKDSEGVQKLLGMIDKSDLKIVEYSANLEKLGFDLSVQGRHNVSNALGVMTLGKLLGIDERVVRKSLSSFSGIGRRMELISDKHGVTIYDDYAHHPTAIAATLDGLRDKYPNAKILAIVEAHGYKRTKALLPKYKGVFDKADKVMVGPIFQARDEIDPSITPKKIAEVSAHKDIENFDNFEKLFENCKLIIGNYNVVVVMGAGKSYLWAKEISKIL